MDQKDFEILEKFILQKLDKEKRYITTVSILFRDTYYKLPSDNDYKNAWKEFQEWLKEKNSHLYFEKATDEDLPVDQMDVIFIRI